MPIGILGSLALSTAAAGAPPGRSWRRRRRNIAVAAVLTGLVPYPKLNVADPVVEGARATGLPWLSLLIEVGALLGLTTVILVLLHGQSRIFATMANDGLLPPVGADRGCHRWIDSVCAATPAVATLIEAFAL